jgi:hypothetical protein
MYQFLPFIFFVVNCEMPEEVDYYWNKLDAGGKSSQCAWLLAQGGNIQTPLMGMLGGNYFGSLTDQFGMPWVLNCVNKT